jgi:hypothetical protein
MGICTVEEDITAKIHSERQEGLRQDIEGTKITGIATTRAMCYMMPQLVIL